jgi:Tol biopolymer transport system component
MQGRTISHFQVGRELGRGGMGTVYRAEDTRLGRPVAIKFLASHLMEAAESRVRFLREAKAAAVLDHPNVCTVFEIQEAEGQTFIVMSLVEGLSLKEKIAERPLKLAEALDIAIQAARGLQAAHDKCVIHRDVKPANVMINSHGQVKVMDFGLACFSEESRLTQTAAILGTPAYMSPEQAQGRPADRRSDVWGLGVVLYEMVTGRLPFQGERDVAQLHSIIHEEPEPPTALRSGLPLELDQVLAKALAKDPARRYQHMDDLRVDLERLAAATATAPSGARPSVASPRSGRRAMLAAGIFAAVVAAVALWWILARGARSGADRGLVILPLTSYRGNAFGPSFSPDGTQVVFVWDGGVAGNLDLYVKVVGATEARRLTDTPEPEFAPAWSPDGRWIAYAHGKTNELRLVSPVGGPPRTLTSSVIRPTWMPGSDGLVFVRLSSTFGAPSRVESIFIESGETRALTDPPGGTAGDRFAAVSPDGKRVAHQRCRTNVVGCELHILNMATRESKVVHRGRVNSLAWMPDSTELIFSEVGSSWLLRQRADASPDIEPSPIVGAAGVNAAISRPGPGGKMRLAFQRGLSRSSIWRSIIPSAPGVMAEEPKEVLASSGNDTGAFLSPDGKHLVFGSDRSGEYRVWLAGADGSNPTMLVPFVTQNYRWGPDGSKVIADCTLPRDRERKPCSIDVKTRVAAAYLLPGDLHAALPVLSASGKHLYFTAQKGGQNGLWKAPAQGGEARQLIDGFAWPMFDSPDERWIYFGRQPPENGEQPLWRMPAEGGTPEKVLDAIQVGTWSPAAKGFYFIAGGHVKLLPYDGGTPAVISKLTAQQTSREMLLNAEGKVLLTTRREDLGTSLFYVDDFK